MAAELKADSLTTIVTVLVLLNYGRFSVAVNPCEYFDGTGRTQLDMEFTESYGGTANDHLPTRGEVRTVSQIHGKVRPKNSSSARVTNQTVVLRPLHIRNENQWHNGSQFSPLEVYFDWKIEQGAMLFRLKRGIDREALNIYLPNIAGVTTAEATVGFYIECTPDQPVFQARNFTVRVNILDVNDNAPLFYNDSMSTNLTMKNFSIKVKEGTPSGVLVLSGVSARDKDRGPNALAAVFMHRHSLFKLAGNSNEIRLETKSAVHYEYFGSRAAGVELRVIIFAVDSPTNASMQMTSQIQIRVTISDDEDPPPLFEVPGCFEHNGRCIRPTYYAEGAGSGIEISSEPLLISPGPIRARKQFGFAIRYSLVGSENPPYFRIDDSTGEVIQLRPIESKSLVTLVVKATKWTDRFDPNFGRASFALLHVSVELTANNTKPAEKFVPWGVHLLSMIAIGTAWAVSVLMISTAFAVFYCWSKRRLCFAGTAAGAAGEQPPTRPVGQSEDQGASDGQAEEQQQQQQQQINDSTCTAGNSSGDSGGVSGRTRFDNTIFNEDSREQSTESAKQKLASYSTNSSGSNFEATNM